MNETTVLDLKAYVNNIEDPRNNKGKIYTLEQLLICLIYGVACGYDNASDIEDFVEANFEYFNQSFGLRSVPSHDTFSRVLRMINVKNLASGLSNFLSEKYPEKYKKYGGKKVLHIDGKGIKASTNKCGGQDTVYFMNSHYEGHTISLYTEKIDDKTNEITAIPKFLDNFNLEECIVTIDAIGCNSTVLSKILANKGSFLVPVKENQKILYKAILNEVQKLIVSGKIKELDQASLTRKSHGRIEEKNAYLLRDTEFIFENEKMPQIFKKIGTILYIENVVETKIKNEWCRTENKTFAITNLTNLSCENLLEIKTSHWSIESSHWLLDVQFNEDRHTARKDNAASNFSVLRRFVIALKDTLKHSDEKFKNLTMHKFFIMNSFNFSKIEEMLFTYDVQ